VTLNGINNLISVNGAATTLSGQIFNGATAGNLTKLGPGSLILTNISSSFTGQTTITGGFLNVQAANGLGTSANVVVATGAALQLQAPVTNPGNFTFARPIVLNGAGPTGNGALENVLGANVVSNAITVNTPTTIGVDAGFLTQNNLIQGPGDLTKVGGGTLVINANNTFTGQFNIANGVVRLDGGQYALGAFTAGTTVTSGATLQ